MRFFHDAEFREDGRTIDMLSYAIVAESGDELYLVNRDADWCAASAHPWLPENVLVHLPGEYRRCEHEGTANVSGLDDCWHLDETYHRVASRAEIADRVRQFVTSYGEDRDEHELWAWYGAYDHVVLAQLFGPMMKLPKAIPMHTNDLKTIVGRTPVPDSLRKRVGGEHDALGDAHWNRLVYNWAKQQEGNSLYAWRQRVAARDSELVTCWQMLTDTERENVRHATRGRSFFRLLDEAAGRPPR